MHELTCLCCPGIMMTLLLGRITKSLFFGQLRDVEVEILYDNARYAITETCLALTIFREELNTRYRPYRTFYIIHYLNAASYTFVMSNEENTF